MRRGRPKLNRPAIDLGTPELQARRQFAVGPRRKSPNGEWWPEPDVKDAEHALGVLLWRGELAPEYNLAKRMYDAGVTFAGWWRVCYPKASPTGTLGALMPGSTSTPDQEEARESLTLASKHLSKSRAVLDAVINAVVYGDIQPRKYGHLRTGLCRLIEWVKSPEAIALKQKRAA